MNLLLSDMPDGETGGEPTVLRFLEGGIPTLFLVLKHNYENSGRTLVLRHVLCDIRIFNTSNNVYPSSDIDSWCDTSYFDLLQEEVKEKIEPVTLPCYSGNIERKAFLLSRTEIGFPGQTGAPTEGTALGYFNSNQRRIANLSTGSPYYWWTRTSNVNSYDVVWLVGTDGTSSHGGYSNSYAPRPAFTLPADTEIDPVANDDGSYNLMLGPPPVSIDIPVENGVLWYVRQYPKGRKGMFQRQLPGAVVSGVPTAGLALGDMPDGESGGEPTLLKFKENGQDVLFLLLKHGYEDTGSLCYRKDIHSLRAYDTGNSNVTDGSDMDVFANGDWINSLEDAVKNAALDTPVPCVVGGTNNSPLTLVRKGFILSSTELNVQFNTTADGTPLGYFNSDQRRVAYLNGQASDYFNRTPSPTNKNSYVQGGIFNNGTTSSSTANAVRGFRPALVLPAGFLLDPTPNADGSYNPIR